MTDKDYFIQLLCASISGQRANPNLEFKGNHSPVHIAVRDAQDALDEINSLYPKTQDKHTPIEKEQKEFAKRISQRNGNVEVG